MAADLFHITRVRDAEQIAREGLRGGAASPSKKNHREAAGEDEYEPDPMIEEPADVKADRELAEALTDVQYMVDEADKFPAHDKRAVYFWTTKNRAFTAARSTNWRGVVVAVDSNDLPDGCRPARGNVQTSTAIWGHYYDVYQDRGSLDEEQVLQWAKDYWKDATWYEGQSSPNDEAWIQCDVPPDAIEYIEDVVTGKVIYEPADAAQATLRDFPPDPP